MANEENTVTDVPVEVVEKESMFNKVKNTVKDHKVIAITAISAAGLFLAGKIGAAIERSKYTALDDYDDDDSDFDDDPETDVDEDSDVDEDE